jgi:hypothetical protein
MRLNIEIVKGHFSNMIVEVESHMKVEDVIALITVQNNHIDFDSVTLHYNGKMMLP